MTKRFGSWDFAIVGNEFVLGLRGPRPEARHFHLTIIPSTPPRANLLIGAPYSAGETGLVLCDLVIGLCHPSRPVSWSSQTNVLGQLSVVGTENVSDF